MKFLIKNKFILILAGLMIIGFVWYSFSGGPDSSSLLKTEGGDGADGEIDKDIVSTLMALQEITLSGTIFSDPAFRELKDFSTEIVPEEVGRDDPFAPLPVVSAAVDAGNINAPLIKGGQ